MPKSSCRVPDLRTLAAGLSAVFRRGGPAPGPVTVLGRDYAPAGGTFESEIVTCRFADGSERRLFCKYGDAPGGGDPDDPPGVAYEAAVYRHVLPRLPASTPAFYGTHTDPATGKAWLVLEYLGEALPLGDVRGLIAAMRRAAQWLGQFQAAQKGRLAGPSLAFLRRYDAAYYQSWARQPYLRRGPLPRRHPWLPRVRRRYEELIELLTPPATLIHGDFQSCNLLVAGRKLFTIDWEWAALAAGEIDLAYLTWGWNATVVRECERAYRQARWPEGAPPEFGERLAAARLYLHFRWLGDGPEVNDEGRSPVSFKMLRAVAERLGIL